MTSKSGVPLLLDQGVPQDAAGHLRSKGFECSHVGELGIWKSTDREILDVGSKQNAVIVTLDSDFHAMLAVSGATGPSVIRLRLEGLGAPEVVSLVQRVLAEFQADLKQGCLVTVKKRKTTSHLLPIGRSE